MFPTSWEEKYEFLEKLGQVPIKLNLLSTSPFAKGNQATVYKIRHKESDSFLAAKIYLTTDSEKIFMVFDFTINFNFF